MRTQNSVMACIARTNYFWKRFVDNIYRQRSIFLLFVVFIDFCSYLWVCVVYASLYSNSLTMSALRIYVCGYVDMWLRTTWIDQKWTFLFRMVWLVGFVDATAFNKIMLTRMNSIMKKSSNKNRRIVGEATFLST